MSAIPEEEKIASKAVDALETAAVPQKVAVDAPEVDETDADTTDNTEAAKTVAKVVPETFQSPSLFVADLAPTVVESQLFEIFKRIGPVSSIRVCRDATSRKSLGYAYVNYNNIADAERAIDQLNFALILNRACRVMWCQRDPSTRRESSGNLFVRNLDRAVTSRQLYDVFSMYGNILSAKIATEETGKSKGFGFVHFENAEEANHAMTKLDGSILNDSSISVAPFKSSSERRSGVLDHFTNLYMKNIPTSWNEEKLREVCSAFGTITSLLVKADKEARPFAFVNYEKHEEAIAAIEGLHMHKLEGDEITEEKHETPDCQVAKDGFMFCVRAVKKDERARMLSKSARSGALKSSSGPMNLYVKHFGPETTDDDLKAIFAPYATVLSATIMRNAKGESRLFGFVTVASQEDAYRCMSELRNTITASGKPLYINIAEKKDQRRSRLMARNAGNTGRPSSRRPTGNVIRSNRAQGNARPSRRDQPRESNNQNAAAAPSE